MINYTSTHVLLFTRKRIADTKILKNLKAASGPCVIRRFTEVDAYRDAAHVTSSIKRRLSASKLCFFLVERYLVRYFTLIVRPSRFSSRLPHDVMLKVMIQLTSYSMNSPELHVFYFFFSFFLAARY